jgi:hypothetical protein
MPKKIYQAAAKVPDLPRVRFMKNAPAGSKKAFVDVTLNVTSVVIEKLDSETDLHALIRLDEKGELVWRTLHQSEQEARWQAKHEYLLEDIDWTPCA